ncbi:MAG TPA: ATP-binding protein [Pedococcus sp.]|jgi:anti-sigma regulatory factor (Ser/Thr protein kinase)|uniref:ATP-binding protein n=1 Tax=Pedococcus sp. TaxID=2860345 RepID=UPI002F92D68F
MGSHGEVTAYAQRGVWLIEVEGDFGTLVQDVDLAIQMALAECPKGVVCSLMHPPSGRDADRLLDSLASAGRHVRRWPGTPIVVVCQDPGTLDALDARPDGQYLGRSPSLLRAWARISAQDQGRTAHQRLRPDALTSRTARRFLARACTEWGLDHLASSASIIVSELVTNAVQYAGGHVDLFLAEHAGCLRIAVRDRDSASPVTPVIDPESLKGRGLRIVETLSQSSGALPAAGGGKLVWAVLGAEPR